MCPKTRKNKYKSGFSLAETAVALALITIVFSMTVTSILAVSSTYKKTENVRFFVAEINNYLECYKMEGADYFAGNVNTYLFSGEKISLVPPPKGSSYDLVICYGADYGKTAAYIIGQGETLSDEAANASYIVKITVNNSFYACVTDSSGEAVFTLSKPYVSRYDYGK